MKKTIIPPIKSQGIKTKLVPWIKSVIPKDFRGTWIEPFVGTGVVAFNVMPQHAILYDTNPHIINFYKHILEGKITPESVRSYLEKEGKTLSQKGEEYYYEVRDRFNSTHNPLDFLFLNRSGFNGMIRFNKKGDFNIPFCKKPNRFSKPYISKIVNQVHNISSVINKGCFEFVCGDFSEAIQRGTIDDIIYCDPPYIDRYTDYYNSWAPEDEKRLYNILCSTPSRFILSTWHHNKYRENQYIKELWSKFNIITKEHFYHLGGKIDNRNTMTEALVMNYQI